MWDVVDRGGGRVEIELARLAASRAEQLEDILDVRRHTEPAPQEAFCQQGRRRQLGEPWKEATKSGGLRGSGAHGCEDWILVLPFQTQGSATVTTVEPLSSGAAATHVPHLWLKTSVGRQCFPRQRDTKECEREI